MFLSEPPPGDATARLFQHELDDHGYVQNLTRLWAWRPEVFEGFAALRNQLTDASSLSPRELAVLVSATAAALGDAYCALAWGRKLAKAAGPGAAAAVVRGEPSPALTARDRALAAWARKVVKGPGATTAADVAELRAAGLGEREIFEATAFIAFRLAFASVNDALGVHPDPQLTADAPRELLEAVRFGRQPAPR